MAQVVEPDLPDLAHRKQLELALGTPARVRVGRRFVVAAALAPALVDVAGHDAGPAHRPAEHVLERRVLRQHRAPDCSRREEFVQRFGDDVDRLLRFSGEAA